MAGDSPPAHEARRLAAAFARESSWALRRLARSPAFALLAALSVGVAVAPLLLFSVGSRAVLPPLPYERAEDLVTVRTLWEGTRYATSLPKLALLAGESETLQVAARTGGGFWIAHGDSTARLQASAVTPSFFDVLGGRPALGRVFRADENETPFGHPVVVLSDTAWRVHFGADTGILGEEVEVNGTLLTVVGVMPPGFTDGWRSRFPGSDAWIPAMMAPILMVAGPWRETGRVIEKPDATVWAGVARLRPGRTLSAARAEASLIGAMAEEQWPSPGEPSGVTFHVLPLSEEAVDPEVRRSLVLLEVAGVLVVLLGALNLASLFRARSLERARHAALHVALGAPRSAVAWGALLESLCVSAAGGVLGVFVLAAALAWLRWAEPAALGAPFGVAFDAGAWTIDAFVVALSLGACVLAGVLVGVWNGRRASRLDARDVLRVGAGVVGGLRELSVVRARGAMVAAQLALALAVTYPALLLVRSLDVLLRSDLGFRSEGVAALKLRVPFSEEAPERAAAYVRAALERLRARPWVESATWMSCLPVECRTFFSSALHRARGPDTGPTASVHMVAPDAFGTLGILRRSGRDFDSGDAADSPRVVVLSDAAAAALGIEGPGERVRVAALGDEPHEVVGLVGNVPYGDLANELLPAVYVPLAQHPLAEGWLAVRSRAGAAEAASLLRRATATLEPAPLPAQAEPLEARLAGGVSRFRGAAWLLGLAAGLALVLGAIGVHGLLRSLVAQSTREIAVRVTLGADPRSISRWVQVSTLKLALAGLALGGAAGLWGSSRLGRFLFRVEAWDEGAALGATVVALLLALLAASRAAARVRWTDPMAVLREE